MWNNAEKNATQPISSLAKIFYVLKAAVTPIKNAWDSKNCLVPLSLFFPFVHNAGGYWEDN